MADTEEKEGAVARHGELRFYKFVFTKIAREVQPDALLFICQRLIDPELTDRTDDFDLIAMLAAYDSRRIYDLYRDWTLNLNLWHLWPDVQAQIDDIIGDRSWAPSLQDLAQGRVF